MMSAWWTVTVSSSSWGERSAPYCPALVPVLVVLLQVEAHVLIVHREEIIDQLLLQLDHRVVRLALEVEALVVSLDNRVNALHLKLFKL